MMIQWILIALVASGWIVGGVLLLVGRITISDARSGPSNSFNDNAHLRGVRCLKWSLVSFIVTILPIVSLISDW